MSTNKTIQLKEEVVMGKKITYYVTKSDKESCERIESINDRVKANEATGEVVGNNKAILIAVGDGMKLQAHRIEPILIKISHDNYRCYDVPLEHQQRNNTFVKLCEDTKTCWQSALRSIGYSGAMGLRTPAYYTAYAIIWKTVENV